MIDKVAHVRNPLTVIAMFAGIAEVSGTIVLPLLEKSTQATYVWFLMLFPCLLVSAFFGTLLFKHHVLYAPSDYKDENLFARMFLPASNSLRVEKLEEEVAAEVTPDAPPQEPVNSDAISPPSEQNASSENSNTEFRISPKHVAVEAARAEDLVINKLSSERGVKLIRNVSPASMPNVMFDAVGFDRDKQYIVEVRYTMTGRIPNAMFERTMMRVSQFYSDLPEDQRINFTFIYAVALGKDARERTSILKRQLDSAAAKWPIRTQIVLYDMDQLKSAASG